MATLVSSAGGLLAMLNDPSPELKLYALSNLNKLVDGFWPEISTSYLRKRELTWGYLLGYAISKLYLCGCFWIDDVLDVSMSSAPGKAVLICAHHRNSISSDSKGAHHVFDEIPKASSKLNQWACL
ncbi:hypothetical protein M0R45_019668 [Rubus argutus]|uniref:26S proteasome non-ATPase regulatory subunit 1/RPN2 N-terminal domain-containing protein n=1 Tax=Rubus argutus TaxID=59490 RepID=A0AAW1X9P7_RUBAR